MTNSSAPNRNRLSRLWAAYGPIAVILCLAAWLRVDGVGFGLPALNDPDEPLFMMKAYDMLARGSLNPQWFGHPGTITLYSLALVMVAVAAFGLLSGRFADLADFAAAVHTDPGIVFLPARLFIVANGVACVWLVYLIGRRLWGQKAGLAAALLLAVNAVHISWSQVIRTDVQASVFMLLCVLQAIAILQDGRLRHYVLAGIFAGLACATKWPAAVVGLCPFVAALYSVAKREADWRLVLLVPMAAGAALIAVSPFLIISYDIVLRDLSGEARPFHPGATGAGFWANLAWYISTPLAGSLGALGLLLAAIGVVGGMVRDRTWLVAVCPGFLAFLVVISTQHLLWERWLVPVLPFFALGLGWVGGPGLARILRGKPGFAQLGSLVAMVALALPMLLAAQARAEERRHDTRQIATTWARAHIPAGSTIVVEHAALDLMQGPWKITFPLGTAGCVDARAALKGQISDEDVDRSRQGSPVVDYAHVDEARLPSCRADYAIFTHEAPYRQDKALFPREYARYAAAIRQGAICQRIAPMPGRRGGPEVLIVSFPAEGEKAAPCPG